MKIKKQKYLSEIFLKEVGGDYSIKSIKKALKICNEELLKRLSKESLLCCKQELSDFYDVYNEFDEEINSLDRNKFLILQLQNI